MNYDAVFIGSGHASWHGALVLAKAGKKVAVVEQELPGGTCTNYGCNAKLALDGAFEVLQAFQNYAGGCMTGSPAIDWAAVRAFKKAETNDLNKGLPPMLEAAGVEFVRGRGRLAGPNAVAVGDRVLETRNVVICTGQRNRRLDVPGKELLRGSREFLDDLEEMPRRIVFAGAGIISMEFASMAVKLGAEVDVVEHFGRALGMYPERYVSRLVAKMEREGVRFHWSDDVCAVEKAADGLVVRTKGGLALACDYALDATGRVANVEDLGLEALGIEASPRGIVVDDHLRTAVPNIYATGDVVCKAVPKLTPTASFESEYVARQILGETDPIRYPAIPNLVFTLPRIAQVGVPLDEAAKRPDYYRIVPLAFGPGMRWTVKNEPDAEVSFVVDPEGRLAGAAVYAADAADWIDYLTFVVNGRLRAADLRGAVFSFPTPLWVIWSTLCAILEPASTTPKAAKL